MTRGGESGALVAGQSADALRLKFPPAATRAKTCRRQMSDLQDDTDQSGTARRVIGGRSRSRAGGIDAQRQTANTC